MRPPCLVWRHIFSNSALTAYKIKTEVTKLCAYYILKRDVTTFKRRWGDLLPSFPPPPVRRNQRVAPYMRWDWTSYRCQAVITRYKLHVETVLLTFCESFKCICIPVLRASTQGQWWYHFFSFSCTIYSSFIFLDVILW